jgi:membrane protein DedA with SNARE-associated domain
MAIPDPHELLAGLAARPALLFITIVLLTFLLEDATALAAGALARGMAVDPVLALSAVLVGTILGDLLLHGAGRLAIRHPWLARRLNPDGRILAHGRSVRWVAIARFVPWMRLPTYTASGLAGMSTGLFLLTVTLTGLVWTPLLFHAGSMVVARGSGLLLAAAILALVLLPRLLRAPVARLLGMERHDPRE